jgi:bacillithiol system protein YtxJ
MKRVNDMLTMDELEAALTAPSAIVLKHGAHCGISASARQELERFLDEHPGVLAFGIEVGEYRALSDAVAARLGVPHQSPQAFVLRGGRPVWHGTHFDITASALADAVG